MKYTKKIFITILGSFFIFVPLLIPFAVSQAAVVPDCGILDPITKTINRPCDFGALLELVNNVINFLLFVIATPLVALILVYVGWLYLSDGGSDSNIKKAKGILPNVVWGYVIGLAAWLIIKTILSVLGFKGPMFL